MLNRLALAGIEAAGLEARLIVASATGIGRTQQVSAPQQLVPPASALSAKAMADRRAAGEPLAYLLGRREFWGLDFVVGPGVLIPRPETELLVEAGLAALAGRERPRLADLGTGSACLLAALLHARPDATGVGTDRSRAALAIALVNLTRHGVAARALLVAGDWGAALAPVDLLVANPPYIEAGALAGLTVDVRDHEPRAALDGGADGLDAYRRIVPDLPRLLRPGGTALLEFGRGQEAAVAGFALAAGLGVTLLPDLTGLPRAARITQKPGALDGVGLAG